MKKDEMMQIVYNQLAIDYNCKPTDFLSDDIIFTVANKLEGRRGLPFIEPRLEIVTFGRGLVVNVSSNIMNYVKNQFHNKTKLEIINSPLVQSFNPYYLPNLNNVSTFQNNFCLYRIIQRNEILNYYKYTDYHNALQYDKNSIRPEMLGVIAEKDNQLIGIACASKDSETMWQIGVDVIPAFRGNNIAAGLVNILTKECLKNEVVPYYTTDIGNINSQKIAVKCGYFPAWSHCFRTRVKNNIMTKSILSRI